MDGLDGALDSKLKGEGIAIEESNAEESFETKVAIRLMCCLLRHDPNDLLYSARFAT
jgi:hypothetical protein